MSKIRINVRKVASPYSDRNGYAVEFLMKDGKRFFVAEMFGKNLTEAEAKLTKPADILHTLAYSYEYALAHKFGACVYIKNFGKAALDAVTKYERLRAELAEKRKARNRLAALVADCALPPALRKNDFQGATTEQVRAAYANAELTFVNAVKATTPAFDEYRKSVERMADVLTMTWEERTRFADPTKIKTIRTKRGGVVACVRCKCTRPPKPKADRPKAKNVISAVKACVPVPPKAIKQKRSK